MEVSATGMKIYTAPAMHCAQGVYERGGHFPTKTMLVYKSRTHPRLVPLCESK